VKTNKKIKFVIPILALILIFSFALACNGGSDTSSTTETGEVSKYNPTNINTFDCADEGEIIRFYFLLEDIDGDSTPGDGQANLQIKDSSDKIVFTQNFSFKSSDFVDYQFKLTGQKIGKAYEWRVDKKDIQKGISDTGTADLTLTVASEKVLKSTVDYVRIPIYSEEEIIEIYDEQYNKNAKINGEVVKKGNFEITLVKYGFYTHLKYDTWGDEVTDFRVDLKIKNIGSEKDSFSTYDAVIVSGSNQYEMSFSNSKLDSSDIYPEIIKEGYLIFEDIPDTLTGQIKIIAGTSYDTSYNELTYEFNVQI